MRRRALLAAAGLLVLGAGIASAQAPNPNAGPRVVGPIASFDGRILSVRTTDGQTVTVAIPADMRIVARGKSTLDALKAGDFAGSAAVEGADGTLRAEEVHIMEGALVGFGEGHRPMAPNPANATAPRTMTNATMAAVEARSMTNATVSGVAGVGRGRVLTMKYKDGEKQIEVAPGTPITKMVVGSSATLKPGYIANLNTQKTDAGLAATQIIIDID